MSYSFTIPRSSDASEEPAVKLEFAMAIAWYILSCWCEKYVGGQETAKGLPVSRSRRGWSRNEDLTFIRGTATHRDNNEAANFLGAIKANDKKAEVEPGDLSRLSLSLSLSSVILPSSSEWKKSRNEPLHLFPQLSWTVGVAEGGVWMANSSIRQQFRKAVGIYAEAGRIESQAWLPNKW